MSDLDGELRAAIAQSEQQAEHVPLEGVSVATSVKPTRRRGNWGLLGALLVVAGGILALVFTSAEDAAIYSVSTDQLLLEREKYDGKTVRVEGDLVKGTLRHRAEPCEYRFTMERKGQRLPVRYSACVVPDTFRDAPDVDVIVTAEGKLTGDYFTATNILAKCPSKYEMQQRAKKGEVAPHAAPGGPGMSSPGQLPPITD